MLARYNQSFLEIAQAAVAHYGIDSTSITLAEVEEILAQLPRPADATRVGFYLCVLIPD